MLLQEPFSGLWNRRGDPIMDGGVRLADILREVAHAGHVEKRSDRLILSPTI
jgi:hypothetical protein